MTASIFRDMQIPSDADALIIGAPEGYPTGELRCAKEGLATFVHVFVRDRIAFDASFLPAARRVAKGGHFWLSYPVRFAPGAGLTRDQLWDLIIEDGYHPMRQLLLDDAWMAVMLLPNAKGSVYRDPRT